VPRLKLIVGISAALFAASAFAQEPLGIVKRTQGHVMLDRGGLQTPPQPGTPVLRGDRLITGPDGHVSIKLHTAGSLSAGPDTVVAPERYVPDRQAVVKPPPAILQGLASFLAVNRQR
jgi:hypothetical protein